MIPRILLTTLAALALAPAAACAATVGVTISADPLEDRAITFVSTGDQSGFLLYARLRAAGSVTCGPTYSSETGSDLFYSVPVGTQKVRPIGDPGAYVVCAYLQESNSSSTAAAASTVPFTVRPNRATLAVRGAPTANPGAGVPVSFAGTTEVGREIYAKAKPGGTGGCGPSRKADPSTAEFAFRLPAIGAFAVPGLTGTFGAPGQYLLCGWLQEGAFDEIAEATASTIVNVLPPLPALTGFDIPVGAFAARGSGPSVTTDSPSGLVTYTLNTVATLRFSVRARRAGRRVGTRCLGPTRARRNRPLCARFVPLRGSFTQNGKSGYNSFRFSGRIGGRRLRRGQYRLYATPTNVAGRGRTLRHVFRIVGR